MQWVGPRRLLVMAGPPFTGQKPVVSTRTSGGWCGGSAGVAGACSAETQSGLVLIAPPSLRHGRARLGPARLVHVTVDGRVRSVRLDRIEAGRRDDGRGRVLFPGLAVDRRGNRAFVVAADGGLIAEVDLGSRRVTYHDLGEPPRRPRVALESFLRSARWLGAGTLAVSGEDLPASEPPNRADPVPDGLRLVDTRTWTIRTVDPEAQTFDHAGGLLLAWRWYAEHRPRPWASPPTTHRQAPLASLLGLQRNRVDARRPPRVRATWEITASAAPTSSSSQPDAPSARCRTGGSHCSGPRPQQGLSSLSVQKARRVLRDRDSVTLAVSEGVWHLSCRSRSAARRAPGSRS